MRLSPTTTLALALAAGLAGPTLAQTAAMPDTGTPGIVPGTAGQQPAATPQSDWQSGASHPGAMQPRASATQDNSQNPAGQAMNADESRIRQAQDQLRAAGLYKGESDGIMGPDTRAALTRFQTQNGLRRTDTLDDQTFARLMSGQPGAPETMGSGSSSPTNLSGPKSGNTTATPGAGDATTMPSAPGSAGGMVPNASTNR